MSFKDYFESKTFKTVCFVIAGLAIVLFIFRAGEFVGFHKAGFSQGWAENYGRNFGMMRGMFRDLDDRGLINPHGTAGAILKIDGDTLTIKDQDDTEKTVIMSSSTVVRDRMSTVDRGNLKVDDRLTVIGSPNDLGQIVAKFIRVFRP